VRADQTPDDVSGSDELDPVSIFAEKPEIATLGFVRVNGRNTMKALSIRQPSAWEIVQGIKVVEFRSWSTKHRGRFFIHASKTIEKKRLETEQKWLAKYGKELPEDWSLGGIVGIATLADCVQRTEPSLLRQVYDDLLSNRPPPGTESRPDSEWFGASYGYILADARPLPSRLRLQHTTIDDDGAGNLVTLMVS
jgi:hypothetical protein